MCSPGDLVSLGSKLEVHIDFEVALRPRESAALARVVAGRCLEAVVADLRYGSIWNIQNVSLSYLLLCILQHRKACNINLSASLLSILYHHAAL